MLFVDLDDFKVVNDTMGHTVGDELLVAAGPRLSSVVRDSDMVARLGGDEFAVLVENVDGFGRGGSVAERIVAGVRRPLHLADGTVIIDGHGRRGDHRKIALTRTSCSVTRTWPCTRRRRRANGSGAATARAERRDGPAAEVQAALEDAVKNSAFTLVYQPIVDADQRRDRRLRGAGAVAASRSGA